jgi:hypothetical protein
MEHNRNNVKGYFRDWEFIFSVSLGLLGPREYGEAGRECINQLPDSHSGLTRYPRYVVLPHQLSQGLRQTEKKE